MEDESSQDEYIFVDDKSQEFKVHCPLCKRVFIDPYITTCGHTFCLKCINRDSSGVCPIDNTHLSAVVKNIAVFEQVGELLIHCKYFSAIDKKGCPVIVKIKEKEEHEKDCEFKLVSCPNSQSCPRMFLKDMQEHLITCNCAKCPHAKYGCGFEGSSESVKTHVKECKYEGIKGYLQSLDGMMNHLQEEISSKNEVIKELRKVVTDLENRLEMSEKHVSHTSKRLDALEEKTGGVLKALTQSSDHFDIVMSKLNIVEHQLGLNPMMEPQHMYKCQGTFVGHKGPVWCLCVSGDYLFSASSDNTIKVWNLGAIYEGPRTMTGHDGIVLAVCSKDNFLYSGSSDKVIKVWNIKTLKLETSFVAHDDPICTLTTHDTRLYSGSLRSIKVWDLTDDSNTLIKILPTQNHWVRALVASGQYLYSGSYGAVKIWNLQSMEVAHVLQCNGGSVYSLALTNRHIVCGTYENMIHVWDINTLAEVTSLSGHVGTVYSLAMLPMPGGQSRLFSASYDKTIRVWSMELFTCAQTMSRHEGSVTCLTINRGRVISGSVDSTIKVWQ